MKNTLYIDSELQFLVCRHLFRNKKVDSVGGKFWSDLYYYCL